MQTLIMMTFMNSGFIFCFLVWGSVLRIDKNLFDLEKRARPGASGSLTLNVSVRFCYRPYAAKETLLISALEQALSTSIERL